MSVAAFFALVGPYSARKRTQERVSFCSETLSFEQANQASGRVYNAIGLAVFQSGGAHQQPVPISL